MIFDNCVVRSIIKIEWSKKYRLRLIAASLRHPLLKRGTEGQGLQEKILLELKRQIQMKVENFSQQLVGMTLPDNCVKEIALSVAGGI
jgi:hypothetical protein